MTADHARMEQRLRGALAEAPSIAGAAALDARVASAISAGTPQQRRGSLPAHRSSRLLPAAAVIAMVAVGAGAMAWLAGGTGGPERGSNAPVGALLATPSVPPTTQPPTTPAATPDRIEVSPFPAGSPAPLPSMDAADAVDALARSEFTSGGWWAPGRLLGRGKVKDDPAGRAIALTVSSSERAEVVLEPRRDGIVRVSSRSASPAETDPLGCASGSFGRYRIAATADRLDLVLVDDACAARVAAVAGTWQATRRFSRPSILFDFIGNPQVEAMRLDMVSAGLTKANAGGYFGDGRAQSATGPAPFRAVRFIRSDATIRIGFPTRAAQGACILEADAAKDALLLTAEDALADLRARPGIEVVTVDDLTVADGTIQRVEVAMTDAPGACARRQLFASSSRSGAIPLWQVPEPAPGEVSAPVYLATVPGRGGATTAVVILVEPTAGEIDRDAVARQVFEAIDWQPELHPPDWPEP